MPQRQFLRVDVPNVNGNESIGYKAPVVLNLPNNFATNMPEKYAFVVDVYGGPGKMANADIRKLSYFLCMCVISSTDHT